MRARMFQSSGYCVALCALLLAHSGCESTLYKASELVGVSKRDILANRMDRVQNAQNKASAQLQKAFDALQALAGYDGDEIQAVQRRVAAEQKSADDLLQDVRDRSVALGQVADALFEEWDFENVQMTDPDLRNHSRQQLVEARERFTRARDALKTASERGDRVLFALRDRVLFIKHDPSQAALETLRQDLPELTEAIAQLKEETRAFEEAAQSYLGSS